MKKFAQALVIRVESEFKILRSQWDGGHALGDDNVVEFFLEDPATSGTLLYHAMIDRGEPLFYGDPEEIPVEWLDEESIQFYFQCSVEEFTHPGYLKAKFDVQD